MSRNFKTLFNLFLFAQLIIVPFSIISQTRNQSKYLSPSEINHIISTSKIQYNISIDSSLIALDLSNVKNDIMAISPFINTKPEKDSLFKIINDAPKGKIKKLF